MSIGEVFLGAFLQVLFEKLLSSAPQVRKFLKKVKGIKPGAIKQLENQLRLVEAVLTDAEERQIHSVAVKRWLEDLQRLFYELEDLLDVIEIEALIYQLKEDPEFSRDESQHSASASPLTKVPSIMARHCSLVKRLISKSKHNLGLASSVTAINARLQNTLSQIKVLKLSETLVQHKTPSTGTNPSWRESTSTVCEPIVYGRVDEKNEIIYRLLNDDPRYENYIVIPIVGKGGIGKTTLAQSIYNDEQLKDCFELKAWVCVSDPFDTQRITTAIFNSATKQNCDFRDLNQASERLVDILKGKRFLIVLDDVWNNNYNDWNNLQIPFLKGAQGSRVIVTTRDQKVAGNMNATPNNSMIKLRELTDDECWCLFQRHAFGGKEMSQKFAAMRDDVVKKCKGLPLAARTLGGLLRCKVEESHWRQILDNDIWRTDDNDVLQVLRLSYHYLPSHLKSCFAYCAIFPKDYEFEEETLILLWMAEGMLPENEARRMEDIGMAYFSELVSRSLFEVGQWGGFKMHDLVSDLAQCAAQDVHLATNGQSLREACCKDNGHVRRISFHGTLSTGQENCLLFLEKVEHLRTFIYFSDVGTSFRNPFFERSSIRIPFFERSSIRIPFFKSKYIRVLCLNKMNIEVLPDIFGDLKLLKLLDLSDNRKMEELPESMGSLCNLQTLLLRGCSQLEKLPMNMKWLIKLRHLEIEGTRLEELPIDFGRMKNLQSLDKFIVGRESGSRLRELRSLNLHKSLIIEGLENVESDEDAREARLREKLGLDELHLSWSTNGDVLEQLRPPKDIKKCSISYYGGISFPKWLVDPSFARMVVITLTDCRCKSLPSLGKLPSLKELYLQKMFGITSIADEFYGDCYPNSFPALQILSFCDMDAWSEWLHPKPDYGKLPCLTNLRISKCKKLQGSLPAYLPHLKQLDIAWCDELSVSLPTLPMDSELKIRRCRRLSSEAGVIRSKRILLCAVDFLDVLGFWVEGLHRLMIEDNVEDNVGDFFEVMFEESNLPDFHYDEKPELVIICCPKLDSLWPSCYGAVDIAEVVIINCPEYIPYLLKNLKSTPKKLRMKSINSEEDTRLWRLGNGLEELSMEDCGSVTCIDELPVTLKKLRVCNCEKLQFVELKEEATGTGTGTGTGWFSTEVEVVGCQSLISMFGKNNPKKGGVHVSKLRIESWLLNDFPKWMLNINSLTDLTLWDLPNMRYFPKHVLCYQLKYLCIHKVGIEEPIRDWGLNRLTSLQTLGILDCKCVDFVKTFPEEAILPSSLTRLDISDFSNLETISLTTLPNLEGLGLIDCPKLKSFLHNWLPTPLRSVFVTRCPLLEAHRSQELFSQIHLTIL